MPSTPKDVTVADVEEAYKKLSSLKASCEKVLEEGLRKFPELTSQLKAEQHELFLLHAAQANKLSAVDVTDQSPTNTERLSDVSIQESLLRKKTCSLKSRKLRSKYHPDRGGDPELFNLLTKAVEVGDLEFIHLLLMKEDLLSNEDEDISPSKLLARIERDTQVFQGQNLFKVYSLYYSNPELFYRSIEQLLKNQLDSVRLQRWSLE